MLGLMFMAGFEVDPVMAGRSWRSSLGIGRASFAVPFGGVFAVCRWGFDLPPMVAGLLGIGLSTTSLALVYGFLRERGLLDAESGQMVLSAAMVVDVLSMIALATLGGNLGWASAIFLIAAVGRWIFARYQDSAARRPARHPRRPARHLVKAVSRASAPTRSSTSPSWKTRSGAGRISTVSPPDRWTPTTLRW